VTFGTIKKDDMRKVFISYSSKNARRARRLAEVLRNHGIDVWFAEWDLLVGGCANPKLTKGMGVRPTQLTDYAFLS